MTSASQRSAQERLRAALLDTVTDYYSSLPEAAQILDRRLFQTLITIVKGPRLQLLLQLKDQDARYTNGVIALWKHADLGASTRRTAAMSSMTNVKFQGDAGK